MSSGNLDFSDTKYISHEQHEELTKRCKPEFGDLLLTKVGTTGIPVLVDTKTSFSIFVSVALIKFPKLLINGNYLTHLIKSPLVKLQTREGTEGIGNKNLVLKKINALKLAIPPLAEQHRIVAKVDELMTLCDRLEAQQMNQLETHTKLTTALLATLTSAKNAEELKAAWQQLEPHFEELFTSEENIEQLKQTILQLAVMGKLVPQDPSDEPASVLLKKIAIEKKRLIAEGKIKKQKPLPKITDEEKPFELPKGWEWVRIGDIGIGSTGKTPNTNKPEYYNGETPFVGPGQITNDGLILESDKSLSKKGCIQSVLGIPGDILMVCIGGSIGKNAIVMSTVAFNQQINCIRPIANDTRFIKIAMNSTYFQNTVIEKATGSATPILNRSKWEEILIPLCSLNEQYRIVTKVEELFSLCDTLKERVQESQEVKVKLADTAVYF